MKQTILRFLLFLIAAVISFEIKADIIVNDLKYSVNTNTSSASVLGLADENKHIEDLVIPDYIEYNGTNYPVARIAAEAFKDKTNLIGLLTIGNSVTDIGNYAFQE